MLAEWILGEPQRQVNSPMFREVERRKLRTPILLA